MKLSYVELVGFRGFREKIRVEFGSGFSVICGRNGVGKSTICDAIEYALTGEIDKYRVEKANQETVADYIWWRGDGAAPAYLVQIGFATENGEFTVKRSREKGLEANVADFSGIFWKGDAKPDGSLAQMLRTSLIRDEMIAALSLDLRETERFELVREALGAVGGPDYAEKADTIKSTVDLSLRRANNAYEQARTALNVVNGQLSEARDIASRIGDINAALVSLGGDSAPDSPISERITAARARLAQDRQRLGRYGEVALGLQEIIAYRQQIGAETLPARVESAIQALETAKRDWTEKQALVDAAEKRLAAEQDANNLAASLAALIQHGEHLGLDDGHCPLCAAARSTKEFQDGIALARARLTRMGGHVQEATDTLKQARVIRDGADLNGRAIKDELDRLQQALSILRQREEHHVEMFARFDLDLSLVNDLPGLEAMIETERGRLLDFERAILTLDASVAVQQVQNLEEKAKTLRVELDKAAELQSQQQRAATKAEALERGVKLASGELIDERLAAISPLLNELYQRLRPHAEWKSIEYAVRGSLRRFLSLRVGDNLNPQFVFSSGQRRTAGLAFLLSVHLAREWCSWKTLVLDDPVQHIDDYRALNLVEVLAALRQSGRQIICAVEDQALADLLCRRLSCATTDGTRIDLKTKGGGIEIEQRIVPALPQNVLRSNKATLAAG